jgi:hypothetical protein
VDYSSAAPTGTFTNNVTNNTLTMTNAYASATATQMQVIRHASTGGANANATANINNNTVLNCAITGSGTVALTMFGVLNAAAFGTVNMNNNVVRGTTSTATTGGIVGVSSQAAVVNVLNLNNNQCGNASGNFITFSAANSGAVNGITTSSAITATVSIANNDIRGIVYSVTGSGSPLLISNSYAGSATATVTGNTFTNLSINSTGGVAFLQHAGNMTATGIEYMTNNSISGTFAKTAAGGTINFFSSNGSSVNGSQMFNTGNNFSNITVTGATTIAGWSNTEGASASSAPVKTISNNTFTNITGGSSAVTIIATNFGNATTVSNNTISNITGTGAITGISHGANNGQGTHSYTNNAIISLVSSGTGGSVIGITGGSTSVPTMNINGNTISTLSSTGASSTISGIAVGTGGTITSVYGNTISGLTGTGATAPSANGITVGSGTAVNIYKNKIYDLSGTAAGMIVNGVSITSASTLNIYNNTIGDLRASAATGLNAINGINASATATYNVYYNSIYLNATSSSGTTFGNSCITFSSTATTLNLRNNVLVNLSTPAQNGSNVATNGIAACLRRSTGSAGVVPTNYNTSSNNNAFWSNPTAGTNNHLTYAEGTGTVTNPQNTVANLKAFMLTRDQASVAENPNFLSTSGASASFLHINTAIATQLESGAVNIATYLDDYDGDTRQGNGGYIGTGTAPDIGADEFEGIALDVTAPSISYSLLSNTGCATDRTFTATITDASGVNTTIGTKPRLYFKKSTEANTYVGNTNADNGWKYVEATNASSPFSFTTNYSLLTTPAAPGDIIQYFVTAQDNVTPTPNVGINSGTFAATPASVALTSAAFPIGGTVNSYTILAGIPTSVTIGAAGTYQTLTGAGGLFATINTNGLIGNTTVTILDAAITETGANALNAIGGGCSGAYTLTIKPATGVTTVLSGSASGGLINLNGADYVTFDGSNNGTTSKDMTIRNTNTSGYTFLLNNDATFNTIMNTIVEGNVTSTTSGVIVFGTAASGVSGNSNNLISNCTIRDRSDATGVPGNLVYSSGTAGILNANNTISNSNLFNFTNSGITVAATGAGDGWSVSANSIYQTASRSAAMNFISIAGGSGHQVLSNYIGGTAPFAGGSNLATISTFRGISLTVGTTSATSVQGNVIRNIRSTFASSTASYGIYLTAGLANIGNVNGNYIGSTNAAERIEINGDSYGIRVSSSSNCNISNNTINNMTGTSAALEGQYYHGIKVDGAGSATIIGNTVMNLTNFGTDDFFNGFDSETFGMFVSATGVHTIRGNTIQNISNPTTDVTVDLNNLVMGIALSGVSAGTVVEKNNISGISSLSPTTGVLSDLVFGIISASGSSASYYNNMISLNSSTNTQAQIFGISDESASPAASTYYYNSVHVYGTAAGSNNTYAFERFNTGTVTLRNNIFSNIRTGGTGFHVAMANTNASASGWSSTASNYNAVYNVNNAHLLQWQGTAAGNNRTLATFQASSGGDANSVNVQPNFISSTDLHLDPTNNCGIDGRATPVSVTVDYDNQTRDALTPDIGADEITANLSTTLAGVVSTTVCDTRTMNGTTNFTSNACGLIATVVPSGGSAVGGTVNACVYIDPATVPTYNAEPYVQRHIDITPSTNPATSTGRVTLYFTDAEFATFNANNAAWPDLPTAAGGGNSDPNIANLRVSQYHGSPLTSPSSPNQYSTGTAVLIDPADADVVWNGSYWAVSFDVTGFSGFYVHTNLRYVLPIEVNYFRGSKQGGAHLLDWKLTCNSTPTVKITLERSSSSNSGFTSIYSTEATAARCNQPFNYTDVQPLPGMNYYRVKMVDANGKITYSGIVALLNATKGFDIVSIAPNPVVGSTFKLNATAAQASKMDLVIIDMQGRIVQREQVSLGAGFSSTEINVANLNSGTYSLYGITADGRSSVLRFVKQ